MGDALYAEFEKLAAQYPDLIENLRGKNRGYVSHLLSFRSCKKKVKANGSLEPTSRSIPRTLPAWSRP